MLTVEALFYVEVLRIWRVGELTRIDLKQTADLAIDERHTARVQVTLAGALDQRHLEQHETVLGTATVIHREVVQGSI